MYCELLNMVLIWLLGMYNWVPVNKIIASYVARLLPPPNGEGYTIFFVCLFVCLSTALRENRWMGFHKIVRIGRTRNLTPLTQDFFIFFRGTPRLLTTLRKNGRTDFPEVFRIGQLWHEKQSGIFFFFFFFFFGGGGGAGVLFNPLIQDFYFYIRVCE